MVPTLEDLSKYVRLTLPQPKLIENLQVQTQAGVVSFGWQGKEFVVKPSLHVLEVRGKEVFITGASMLIQSTLMKRDKNEKVISAAIEVLIQVEDLIKAKRQVESGLKLLDSVKSTLRKLSGKHSTP